MAVDNSLAILAGLLETQLALMRILTRQALLCQAVVQAVISGQALDNKRIADLTKELGVDEAQLKAAVDAAQSVTGNP